MADLGGEVCWMSPSLLLELAANNDLEAFKKVVEEHGLKVDKPGIWYCRQYGSNKMAMVERTPGMIAALFGSLDVLDYILKQNLALNGNINQNCGSDQATALHCAFASGTKNAMDVVNLLLHYGADPNAVDAQGLKPLDINLGSAKQKPNKDVKSLDVALQCTDGSLSPNKGDTEDALPDFSSESSLADLDEIWGLNLSHDAGLLSDCKVSTPPASSPKSTDSGKSGDPQSSKEFPSESLLSDIKNSIYTTDEFRMYSFKVRPCSRAYSHDWTECPFVHPGENARRRDPRRFHYSCVPCPDFRKGSCKNGDACEYSHGVFESWLHPAQYRTRLCKDGTSCTRRVCFFAHTKQELRPLYLSTECAVPSPRSMSSLDVLSATYPLGIASPSGHFIPPSLSLPAAHPSSPVSSSPVNSPRGMWNKVNGTMPASHVSRLQTSFNCRDVQDELDLLADIDGQLMSEITSLSARTHLNSAIATTPRTPKSHNVGLNLASNIMEDVAVSPRSPLQMCLQSAKQNTAFNHAPSTSIEDLMARRLILSPQMSSHPNLYSQLESEIGSQKSSQMSHFQSRLQSLIVSQMQGPVMTHSSAPSSPSGMNSTNKFCRLESDVFPVQNRGSPLSPARAVLSQREKKVQGPSKDSELWPDWGSPTGKLEWGVSGDDLTRFRSTSLKVDPTLRTNSGMFSECDIPLNTCSVNELRDGSDHKVIPSWMGRDRVAA